MELRELYSLLRRGFIGRFGDAYIIATLLDATGFWPGLITRINAHPILFAAGALAISLTEDLLRTLTKPERPPCASVEPELNLEDDDK